MTELLKNFVADESGQDLAEYALLLALIALALVAAIGTLSGGIQARFEEAGEVVENGPEEAAS